VTFTVPGVGSGTQLSRTGILAIADQTISVYQYNPNATCDYMVVNFFGRVPDSIDVPASGGTFSFVVEAADTCSWTAGSRGSFITITSGFSGLGYGEVTFRVDPNPTGIDRSGRVIAEGRGASFGGTVYQSGR